MILDLPQTELLIALFERNSTGRLRFRFVSARRPFYCWRCGRAVRGSRVSAGMSRSRRGGDRGIRKLHCGAVSTGADRVDLFGTASEAFQEGLNCPGFSFADGSLAASSALPWRRSASEKLSSNWTRLRAIPAGLPD